jgi:predicted ATPase
MAMITLIEAHNFRCLHYISQPLSSFQILIGSNASGKTTFLDTLAFLSDLVVFGPEQAVAKRTDNFADLVWQRQKNAGFELAIEAQIPEKRRKLYDTIRYEVKLTLDPSGTVAIAVERVLLKKATKHVSDAPLFSILSPKSTRGVATVINRSDKYDHFYSEPISDQGSEGKSKRGGYFPSFNFGGQKSLLSNLPNDETIFPASTWLKKFLSTSVQQLVLNSQIIRQPSPPTQSKIFNPDGSNLPHIINHLRQEDPDSFNSWIDHIKIALPDITDIEVIERPDNKYSHLIVNYQNCLKVPSWLVSDGTLRFLALTLPAYLKDLEGTFLIEEPENGIHPRAIELVLDSLSSIYEAQVFLATHSPIILSQAKVEDILCLAKTPEGATNIVQGKGHPRLKNWKGQPGLDVMFASGVLNHCEDQAFQKLKNVM